MIRRTLFVLWNAAFSLLGAQPGPDSSRVALLAFGDMNLGRTVGQILLKDSLEYPFEHVRGMLTSGDLVFANLESQISDQGGETQHPRDRFIFCAPPQAAGAIRWAGISVVSTANNHAFDYGMKGLQETIEELQKVSVPFVGTSLDSVSLFPPLILQRKGIRFGFVAYTQFLNRKQAPQGHISIFDKARMVKEITGLRSKVDVVVASYHGGVEYVDKPNKATLRQLRELADAGADIVLGHHPHVPQGIERYKKAWIIASLGNFVFFQPQHFWTQLSFGCRFEFSRDSSVVSMKSISLLPLKPGFQPAFNLTGEERRELLKRLQLLSNVPIMELDNAFIVQRDVAIR